MNVLALAAAAALRLLDPTGDAAGDGTLLPPTSPAYANVSVFDIQEVTLAPGAGEGEPTVLAVSMGSIELSETTPAGFNKVVLDVYIDHVEGGAEATLAGPGLLMPPGRGWDHVVRVTPRGAFGAVAPLDPEVPVSWRPLDLVLDGDTFVVTLPWTIGQQADVYAVSGLYDAFSPTDWREVSPSPSPWSFSSESQRLPVVDVLAVDQAAQVRVLEEGVLPAPVTPRDSGLPWLALSVGGVLIALYGLWLRRRVPAPAPAKAEPEGERGAEAPGGEPAAVVPEGEDAAEAAEGEREAGVPEGEEAAEGEREAEATRQQAADDDGGAVAPDDAEARATEEPAPATGDAPDEPGEAGTPEEEGDAAEGEPDVGGDAARPDPLAGAWGEEDDEEDDDLAGFVAGETQRRGVPGPDAAEDDGG